MKSITKKLLAGYQGYRLWWCTLGCILWGIHGVVMAQEIPVGIKGYAEYVDIGIMDSLTKEVFFERGQNWLTANGFKVKKATVIKDLHEWKIIVNGKTEVYEALIRNVESKVGRFSYILSIHCKDGKYKCIINEIQYDSNYIPDLIGTDISVLQPFKDERYIKDGFVTTWLLVRNYAHKDITLLLSTLKMKMLGLTK